jgi:hypothetical protein
MSQSVIQMKNKSLQDEIDEVMPPVDKPSSIDISFHKDDCGHCVDLRKDLEKFKDQTIPEEAIKEIYMDMSSLSAKGWRWVMPSYLKHIISTSEKHFDSDIEYLCHHSEAEFLIYNLAPNQEYEKEQEGRLSEFSEEQLYCLINFLEWCGQCSYFREFLDEEISNGKIFIKKCIIKRSSQTR